MSALLIDTAVWADHFAGRDGTVAERLLSEPVHTHEFILGELMLGVIPRNHPAADRLQSVPRLATLPHDDVLGFVRLHRLEGSGIGWIDAHLLAAARVFGAALWTRDRALLKAASRAGVRHL